MHFFAKKFGSIKKKQYLCTRFKKQTLLTINLNFMETIYVIGYQTQNFKNTMFFGFDENIGRFLTKDINKAQKFKTIERANLVAGEIIKYFFNKPTQYSIFKGTKK